VHLRKETQGSRRGGRREGVPIKILGAADGWGGTVRRTFGITSPGEFGSERCLKKKEEVKLTLG